MNSPRLAQRLGRGVAPLALFLAAGCATSKPATATADDEYEYVTPIGSNIPVKVRKGAVPAGAGPSSSAIGGDAARDAFRRIGPEQPPTGASGS